MTNRRHTNDLPPIITLAEVTKLPIEQLRLVVEKLLDLFLQCDRRWRDSPRRRATLRLLTWRMVGRQRLRTRSLRVAIIENDDVIQQVGAYFRVRHGTTALLCSSGPCGPVASVM